MQRLRGIIDIMDTHARRLVADKIAAVRGESGEGAAFADVDSESTDIMSTMGTSPAHVSTKRVAESPEKYGRTWMRPQTTHFPRRKLLGRFGE